ncbi:alpha/beta fold hydrolase [Nocardia beijingensis]|uniref:thioesterase domain-containing protein n=1 Tax=Nocardia beijingensis TaxID=95162 RepID=UPI00344E8E52
MIEFRIMHIIGALLKLDVADMSHETDFFEAGGNSLLAGALIAQLEASYGVHLTLKQILSRSTVGEIANACRVELDTAPEEIIYDFGTGDGSDRIFFVHGRSGEVYFLQPAIKQSRERNEPLQIAAIRSRGLDGRHEPFISMADMAAFYVDKICEFQPAGPYVIAGFCLGGMIAWEVTRQLISAGHQVSSLLIFDTVPCTDPLDMEEREQLISGRHAGIENLAKAMLPESTTSFSSSPWEEIVAELHAEKLLPADVTAQDYERRMQVIGRNLAAFWEYRPENIGTNVLAVFGPSIDDESREYALAQYSKLASSVEAEIVHSEHDDFFADKTVFDILARENSRDRRDRRRTPA